MRLLRQFNCVIGIDVKNAAEWHGLYTGLPLAIVGALNLEPEIKIQTFSRCQIKKKTDPWLACSYSTW